jgi:hypothetical protein
MNEVEIEAMLDQLSTQQAIQTEAIKAALEARWTGGADTVDGHLHALNPHIQTSPKVPLYE